MQRTGGGGKFLGYLSLFTSVGTLLCCALPSLFILFGLGAAVASTLTQFAWLVSVSRHKNWVFGISGILIAAGFVQLYVVSPRLKASSETCAADDSSCDTASRITKVCLWFSAAIYAVGAFTAFALGPILGWMDSR